VWLNLFTFKLSPTFILITRRNVLYICLTKSVRQASTHTVNHSSSAQFRSWPFSFETIAVDNIKVYCDLVVGFCHIPSFPCILYFLFYCYSTTFSYSTDVYHSWEIITQYHIDLKSTPVMFRVDDSAVS